MEENKNCVLIMAGGKGTRFWPKSTEEKPKQFLNLIGEKTMIQETFDRINKKIPSNQIFVVTCQKYKNLVEKQLPNLPEKNIIIEPIGRNTAPCILLSTIYIQQIFENANIAVLPSDHLISNIDMFLKTLETAMEFLKSNKETIVTIGIKPDRPETGYGYIKTANKEIYLNEMKIVDVEKFVEKPDIETANQYLQSGRYLWNAGMFVFNSNYMLKELKENYSSGYNLLSKLPPITDKKYQDKLKEIYEQCETISIDYAIMERADSIHVIPSNFGWDDIGTWKALQRYIKPDEASNIIKGEVKAYNSSNNVVYAEDKKIILLDVDDIFFIESNDLIVVGKKDKISEVYQLRNKNLVG